ncbi:hypothetical protein GLOTRDRAFT_117400 [Gloeophyllum trabeum ATCC 11539]|uniref:Ubiquinone biosynthesis protein n=1 Tax=Gloeophyllum trabeum (strain ATCC 11539 / FP-39264 / Madison 617) TaxID=670483 RepID=S7REE7_GLOTA|nr:uncharacterized protein GLOTRDRAFT_117400 [Gloeophyllum trabeum ATCC 11539]EPQ52595.1 hypothetical protein GLOTRDRAFT_117400 [Gloeophyllum trabeum ATCC 11539]
MASPPLLRAACALVPTHGFTRRALALSALSLPQPHEQPLSDTAINALFGEGDDARRTLADAWLENAREEVRGRFQGRAQVPRVNEVLEARLEANEPVLRHLPEAFALLASPTYPLPPLDPRPGLKHAFKVADDACRIAGEATIGTDWYVRRGTLAAIYAAAELHQLTSPTTAYAFLDTLLAASATAKSSLDDVGTFANYIARSWAGIVRSSGVF